MFDLVIASVCQPVQVRTYERGRMATRLRMFCKDAYVDQSR